MLKFCLLAVLSIAFATAGNVKIIGGVDTDITEVPYQVALESGATGQYCGGVIISQNFILTAAHCLSGYDESDTTIRAGSSLREEGGQMVRAKNFTIHPKYDAPSFDHDYDAGIIELTSAIHFDENAQPIALAEDEVDAGNVVKISGWGVTSNMGDASKQLQSVEVPVMERDECGQYFALNVTARMICGYSVGHNACNGDSGGPVVYNKTVVGVVSWSKYQFCAEENSPGVYSNIGNGEIRSFIKDVTGL